MACYLAGNAYHMAFLSLEEAGEASFSQRELERCSREQAPSTKAQPFPTISCAKELPCSP